MKKIILILLFCAFFQNNSNAQAPINVLVTGECMDVSGTYLFSGLVNGKNNYVSTFTINGETSVIGVGFDGEKWVLYADNDITDSGFSNISVPNGLLPPFIGWSPSGCSDGTMIIHQNLATTNVASINQSTVIYPNPATNFMIIENAPLNNLGFDYRIFDLSGRLINQGISQFGNKIDVENLKAGNYMVEVKVENGSVSNKMMLKK